MPEADGQRLLGPGAVPERASEHRRQIEGVDVRWRNAGAVSHLWLRFSLLIVSLILASSLLSLVEPPLSWPIVSGFGGTIGSVLQDTFHRLFKNQIFILGVASITLVTVSLAFGMSWSEWKTAGRTVKQAFLMMVGVILSLLPRGRYADDDDDYDAEMPLDPQYVAALQDQLAATNAAIHNHNLAVQAFANQASANRPRARTAPAPTLVDPWPNGPVRGY